MYATHLSGLCENFQSSHPQTFDTNRRAIEGPMIHLTKTTRGKRMGTDAKKVGRNRIRCWERRVCCAYASELAQALSGSGTRRIETVESLLASLSVQ